MSESRKGEKSPWYGRRHTEEEKRKIGEGNKGKVISDEAISKIKEKRKNQIFTEETRKKMSESQKGRKHSEETKEKIRQSNLGKKFSEESKKRMSIAQSKLRPNQRKIILVTDEKGNELGRYISLAEASKQTGVPVSTISQRCLGHRISIDGSIWKYAPQNN